MVGSVERVVSDRQFQAAMLTVRGYRLFLQISITRRIELLRQLQAEAEELLGGS